MEAEQAAPERRVPTQYSEQDRERLIGEQAESGLTKREFCEQRGINLGTFYGWSKRGAASRRDPTFAQVQVAAATEAAIEVLLPNGVRIGIRHQGSQAGLVSLVRSVAGAPEATQC